jgi:hypothetical protein
MVKYEAPLAQAEGAEPQVMAAQRQSGLALHTDGSIISFNVLLGDPVVDFDGGGTYFPHLGCVVAPDQGGAVVHDGKKKHAGIPVRDETTTPPPTHPAAPLRIRTCTSRPRCADQVVGVHGAGRVCCCLDNTRGPVCAGGVRGGGWAGECNG